MIVLTHIAASSATTQHAVQFAASLVILYYFITFIIRTHKIVITTVNKILGSNKNYFIPLYKAVEELVK